MSYLQKHVGFDFSLWNSDHTSGMFDPEFLQSTRCFFPHMRVCFASVDFTVLFLTICCKFLFVFVQMIASLCQPWGERTQVMKR